MTCGGKPIVEPKPFRGFIVVVSPAGGGQVGAGPAIEAGDDEAVEKDGAAGLCGLGDIIQKVVLLSGAPAHDVVNDSQVPLS